MSVKQLVRTAVLWEAALLDAPLRVKPRLEAGASIWRHRLTPGLLDFGPAGSIKLCERHSRVRIAIQGL